MFEQLQLKIKRGNRVLGPDESWTSRDQLYCAGRLQLGFGQVMTWEGTDLLSMRKLAALYHDLYSCTRGTTKEKYQHSFLSRAGRLHLNWVVNEDLSLAFIVSLENGRVEQVVMTKTIAVQQVAHWIEATYVILLGQAAETVPAAVTLKVGALLDTDPDPTYLYSPGQKVRTVLNTRVRTLPVGYIFHRYHQAHERSNVYQLLVDGKAMEKRYREEDLEIVG